MFGPMIFRQVERFRRSRARNLPHPQAQPQQRRAVKQKPVEEEVEYVEEDFVPEEDEFVDPINN